ncbi:hypothetical protein K469DRAFT_697770 [Zopfia rhizophila CBS 207.26]|uniref:Ig-like domain-containing protein n=1 Tax=Zopfia rhizophila CBS 207.26 TaxID=1314779 RepID=A0A6A6EHE1_9PEZI|nr:hypothetical protein K469DRAFT_697770 [Zopfia rhizophila CBS 207.26]
MNLLELALTLSSIIAISLAVPQPPNSFPHHLLISYSQIPHHNRLEERQRDRTFIITCLGVNCPDNPPTTIVWPSSISISVPGGGSSGKKTTTVKTTSTPTSKKTSAAPSTSKYTPPVKSSEPPPPSKAV